MKFVHKSNHSFESMFFKILLIIFAINKPTFIHVHSLMIHFVIPRHKVKNFKVECQDTNVARLYPETTVCDLG